MCVLEYFVASPSLSGSFGSAGNECLVWSCPSSTDGWLVVGFVALRPKSTAMVIAGRSVHLTTLFPGQAWTSGLPVIRAHTFACNWQQPFLNESAEGGRMTVEIISWSIATKVWDRTGIELATPGSAVRHASVARHVTVCATRPGTGGWTRPVSVPYEHQALSVMPSEIILASTTIPGFGFSDKARLKPVS